MKHYVHKNFLDRYIVVLILVAVVLLPLASKAQAVAELSQEQSEWTVTISGLSGTVCAGDPHMLTVRWYWNDDGSSLAPLTGPKAISVSAKLGSLDHETERAVAPSGVAMFRYFAKKDGGEQITVKVFNQDLEVDTSDMVQFEVEKCQYRYELFAELYDDVVGDDIAIGYLLTYRSKGKLEAPNPDQPDHLESIAEMIKFMMTATYFNAPGCSFFTSEPGKGIGFVDVKAEPASNGLRMHVTISPPRDASWDVSNTIVCDGEPHTSGGAFPISSGNDPWIEKSFLFGGGTYPVTIDILEETVKNARGKGHIISYKATLKLERMVEQ